MEFLPGRVRLSDIVNGVLGAGRIPFVRLLVEQNNGGNAAPVTVLSTSTVILSLGLGVAPVTNDFILAIVRMSISKGATAGNTVISAGKSAGSTSNPLFFFALTQGAMTYPAQPASSLWEHVLVLPILIQSGGSFILEVSGTSAGSNGSVGINGCRVNLFNFGSIV